MSSTAEIPQHDGLRVESLINRYRRELSTRLRDVRGLILTTVAENDALGLSDPSRDPRANVEPADSFGFGTKSSKRIGFDAWLQRALNDEFLEEVPMHSTARGNHYTGEYVRLASDRGAKRALAYMEDAGIDVSGYTPDDVWTRPVAKDTLKLLYTRNYKQLEGIYHHTDQQLSRIVAESFAEGRGAYSTASRLNKEIRTIDRNRAKVLARTEFMNAYNRTALTAYKDFDVSKVDVLISDGTCAICRDIASDGPYTLANVPTPPFHPNCTCTVSPVV